MTKEEAIKQLKIELSKWESDCKSYHKTKDALDMGIKALQDKSYELWKESYVVEHQRNIRLEEKIKELEQKSCEDAVNRKDVFDMIEQIQDAGGFIGYNTYSEAFDRVDNMPSVRPVSCIAKVEFNKEDMQKIVDEKVEEIMAGNRVTCKDCKHLCHIEDAPKVLVCGKHNCQQVSKNYYCADAEREEVKDNRS